MTYKVLFEEFDLWSGMDSWLREYASQHEARQAVLDNNNQYLGKPQAPEYYVRATYMGNSK